MKGLLMYMRFLFLPTFFLAVTKNTPFLILPFSWVECNIAAYGVRSGFQLYFMLFFPRLFFSSLGIFRSTIFLLEHKIKQYFMLQM